MAPLDNEIAAFEKMQADLEANHMGEWVLIHGEDLIGTYESLDAAARVAVTRFGSGPYLIRQVGEHPVTLPASVLYHPHYANDKMRL